MMPRRITFGQIIFKRGRSSMTSINCNMLKIWEFLMMVKETFQDYLQKEDKMVKFITPTLTPLISSNQAKLIIRYQVFSITD